MSQETRSNLLRGAFTIATLPDGTPPPIGIALRPGLRLWCSDLFGEGGWVEWSGERWRAAEQEFVHRRAAGAGAITLRPLHDAPNQIFDGALPGVLAITLSAAEAWRGARFTITREAAGLGALSLLGRSLEPGGWADAVFDGSAWAVIRSAGVL
jgi:hypothetical protein